MKNKFLNSCLKLGMNEHVTKELNKYITRKGKKTIDFNEFVSDVNQSIDIFGYYELSFQCSKTKTTIVINKKEESFVTKWDKTSYKPLYLK